MSTPGQPFFEDSSMDYGRTQRGLRDGLKLFQRYRLVRQIGRGGMGVVWLAHDERLDLQIALKFLPENLVHDEAALDDLRRETKRCLRLTHPNVVRIYDLVEEAGTAAIAMEFVDGKPLSALRLERGNRVFDVEQLRPWLQNLCEGLTYAHTEGHTVHRDLKPANILVAGQTGRAKIADFGVARSLCDSMSRVSVSQGSSGGTLVYMSPQQASGYPPSVGDDVYSLGAMIYELLTGKPPFFSGNLQHQIESMVPPTMKQRREDLRVEDAGVIPAAWEQTVAACLEKDPQKRPTSIAQVWEGLNSSADEASQGVSLSDGRHPGTTEAHQPSGNAPRSRFASVLQGLPQKKMAARVAALLAVVLLIGFAVTLWPGFHRKQVSEAELDTLKDTGKSVRVEAKAPAKPSSPANLPKPEGRPASQLPAAVPISSVKTASAPESTPKEQIQILRHQPGTGLRIGGSIPPEIVRKALASVASISVFSTKKPAPAKAADGGKKPKSEEPPKPVFLGMGSGIVLTEDGYILSYRQLLTGADELEVIIGGNDRKVYPAVVIGTDAKANLTVLKIDVHGAPTPMIADPLSLHVGDVVLAVGSPMMLKQSLSRGKVRKLHDRLSNVPDEKDFINSDAAVGPGSFGGALLDAWGNVIGIHFATNTQMNEGFAIPIHQAVATAERLVWQGAGGRSLLAGIRVAPPGLSAPDPSQYNVPLPSEFTQSALRGVVSITVEVAKRNASDAAANSSQAHSPNSGEKRSASGITLTEKGYILTNFHVVNGAARIQVALHGGAKRFSAKIIGTDPTTDLAVIKIDGDGIPAAVIGDDSKLRVGDTVLTCLRDGLESSVSAGIVSALHRRESRIIANQPNGGYEDFIQYNAACRTESEGGPLLDCEGSVVGVNTLAVTAQVKFEKGFGFAVPINMAMEIARALIVKGKAERGFLGVLMGAVDAEHTERLAISDGSGVQVVKAVENSPAAQAGLEMGDVIVSANGHTIGSTQELRLMVGLLPPGSIVALDIVRLDNESNRPAKKTLVVKLGVLPADLPKL